MPPLLLGGVPAPSYAVDRRGQPGRTAAAATSTLLPRPPRPRLGTKSLAASTSAKI